MRLFGLLSRGLAVLLVALLPLAAAAQQAAPAATVPVARYLVKLRVTPAELNRVASRAGFRVLDTRHIVAGIQLLRVEGVSTAQTLARLRADPQVEYAEEDQRRYAQALPDDPLFAGQWYLQNTQPAAIDAVEAWDLTTGSDGVVIAALDTGVRFDHPDLRSATANRLLPGYDMIGADSQGNFLTTNDSNGRDPDASDPGDWVSAADMKNALFAKCTKENSSWHGTRVAGILGASPTTAPASPALPGVAGSCRCACSASAAVTTPTSSPAWPGRPATTSTAFRIIPIRPGSST